MQTSPVFDWGKNFADKIDLSNDSKILDIGCRKGNISSYLAQKYQQQQFIAIDNSNDEIEQAKTFYQFPNLMFETVDALLLDCSENFDAVVSFSCLHWISDKTKTLQNIYQALKPGGKAFIQFFALHGRNKNDRFFYQIAQTAKWKNYFKNFSPAYSEITLVELSRLLHGVGFMIHSIDFPCYETLYEHPQLLHQWLATWVSHTKHIPIQKRDLFLEECVDEYLTFHHYSPQDQFPYYEYLLEVVCEKPLNPPISLDDHYRQYGAIVFTKKEAAVLKYYLQGKSAKEISFLLAVSAKTIEFHLGKIKEKLGVHRRSDIYQAALTHGFINLIY